MIETLSNKTLPSTFDIRFVDVEALIVKVTRRCNLNCTYCYENIVKDGDMTIDVFKQLAEKAISSSSKDLITFIFHGGEPTLLPNSFYESAADFCISLSKEYKKKVKFDIQTNLLFITDEKIELFKKYDFAIGASVDGPFTSSETMRLGADKFVRNYFKLRENKLGVGLLATINQTNYYKFPEITKWIFEELKAKSFKANPVYSVGNGYNLPDMLPEQVFLAQKDIVDNLIATKGLNLIERNISTQIDWFFRESNHSLVTLCHSQTCGAGKKVIGITTDGNLLPCGRFQWNDYDYYLGQLETVNQEYLQKVEKFHSLVPENWFDCNDCSAKKICGFGCQAFILRSKSNANIECLPTKMLHEYFEKNVTALLEINENIKKRDRQQRRRNNKILGYSDSDSGGGNSYSDYDDRGYKDKDNRGYIDYSDKGYRDTDDRGYKDYGDRGYTDKGGYQDYNDKGYSDYDDRKYDDYSDTGYNDDDDRGYEDYDDRSYRD